MNFYEDAMGLKRHLDNETRVQKEILQDLQALVPVDNMSKYAVVQFGKIEIVDNMSNSTK